VIGPGDERARRGGEAFTDAVSFSFADPRRGWFGLVRLGLSGAGGSLLAVLMKGRDPVGALAEGRLEAPAAADWAELALGPAGTTVQAPLEVWTVAVDGGDWGVDLRFDATSAPAAAADRLTSVGGMEGYEQLCRVAGTVRWAGGSAELDGLGQRGHAWGEPDWGRIEATRAVSAWLEDGGGGITLATVRPQGAAGHDDEVAWAVIVRGGEPVAVQDPRLSTTYDADGRQRRAGLELWLDGEDYPLRAAGEALCGTTLDLGALRLDVAFLRWSAEGREGVGRYDIVRRA